MKPMRVLQVVTIMNRGGLETMLMNYYRQMDRNKIQFDFMVHRVERGHYDDEIESLGGHIYRMPPIRPGNYRKYFHSLKDFFAKNRDYKVVHAHNNENSSFVLREAKKAGVPSRIAHSHLSDLGIDLKLPFRLYARYYMKDNPTQFFACSKKAGQWLFGKRNDITVLNNAVNVNDFSFNQEVRSEIRKDLNIDDQLVIGHIGRFNKQKNHDFLIEVFKSIHDRMPNSLLLLAGEGHLRLSIEDKVKRLGLSENVHFLGVRKDVQKLMQAMDVFLFPSLFEGLPVVLVEAQAAGLKSFVSNTVTEETNVTGQLEFLSLKDPSESWANKILSATYEHKNTLKILREKGYDTSTMSHWLTEFYFNQSSKEVEV
ncbi:glycosyltransferase family 1 protein [Metabacillus dongyingensis]|uniref:glycosyltransferase family 1 protein n=1 Tax=Metabacillus dongyingensis TaxID=2874282 RepID=UPI001CBE219D|nr:glycosyltransferase family 1 protein [Metabacillus dongyingensis]UAL50271.1 glycosyltransferase family 1 protein [Metabacillus dongyingensis]